MEDHSAQGEGTGEAFVSDVSVKVDYALGTAAASAPWWLPHFDHTVHVILGVGGVALVLLRVAIAWRDWRNKHRGQ
jgi:uncharacterized membrane protein YozB (DUF420 family)